MRSREVNRERQRIKTAARHKRLLIDPTIAQHGRASTYCNWGCRCAECTEAMRIETKRKGEKNERTADIRHRHQGQTATR
jgi:hypothetical protein